MNAIMEGLTLFDEFNLDLEDFLPDTDPQGQSALPLTPMPNQQVDKKIFENRKKMLNTINNAQTIGLSPTESFEIFEKRGLQSDYDEITAGQFDPFYPSDKLQDVFEDNARRGNVPNVFLEAEPTLRAIEAAMSNLTLFDDFNLQLEYFFTRHRSTRTISITRHSRREPS